MPALGGGVQVQGVAPGVGHQAEHPVVTTGRAGLDDPAAGPGHPGQGVGERGVDMEAGQGALLGGNGAGGLVERRRRLSVDDGDLPVVILDHLGRPRSGPPLKPPPGP